MNASDHFRPRNTREKHGKASRSSGTTEYNFSVFRVFSGQKVVVLFFLILMALAPHPALAQDENVPEWAVGLKALADENGMEFPWNEWDELMKAADDSLTSDTLDRDGDGLFMNIDPNDYNPDVDDDGFTDGYEVNNGTDPESKDSCPPLGDVNLDGLSNNLDAILIFNYTLGNVTELSAPENGEVDLDGALNNLDAIVLFNWTLSNISLIPNPALPERIHLVKQNDSGHFTTIQEAVDAATTGDTVIVYPGTYYENVMMREYDISLTSTDPLFSSTVESTTIDGSLGGAVVSFMGTESTHSLLAGMTLTNGLAAHGAGIQGNGTLARIMGNRITHNCADQSVSESSGTIERGAGIDNCDGVVENNLIAYNRIRLIDTGDMLLGYGAGIADCNGVIRGNTVEHNTVFSDGGAALESSTCYITRNTFRYNRGTAPHSRAAINLNNGVFTNNLCCWNQAGFGNISFWGSMVINCTFFVPKSEPVDGIYLPTLTAIEGVFENCIVDGDILDDYVVPAFCCIKGWNKNGEGNISEDPLFVSKEYGAGDFGLSPLSPCIDAGKRIRGLTTDLEGTVRPSDGTDEPCGDGSDYDIGAIEFYREGEKQ